MLRGLGVTSSERVTFTLQSAAGRRDVALAPIAASSYSARFPDYWQPPAAPPGVRDPLWLRYRGTAQAVTTLQRGRFVYLGYTPHGRRRRPRRSDLDALARKPAFRV